MCKIKYPLEVMSAINKSDGKTKTISVESYLMPADDKEHRGGTQDPLKFYEDFSCFHITLILKEGDKKTFARANLSVRAVAKLDRRTQVATKKIIEQEGSSRKIETGISSAYTQQIRVGKLKGKTPAQVLLENPNSREQLEGTAKWLKEKGNNHEGNKAQYNAIMEGISLLEKGELCEDVCEKSGQIVIHKAEYRPLFSTKREDGKIMSYTLQILCNVTDRMPYEIRVGNVWALYNGMEMVPGSSCDRTGISIRLTEEEWDDAVESMKRTMRIYERCYGKYELERAMTYNQQNREEGAQ